MSRWGRYVPVAEKKARAAAQVRRLQAKGRTLAPVSTGRVIAQSVWGKAWCTHLESYSDLANRLPRGRTYVRNGSVLDLQVVGGEVTALVAGTQLYEVELTVAPLKAKRWEAIRSACAGGIDSMVALLRGELSGSVMEVVCQKKTGLFPAPRELDVACSCPDWATVCKHVAAVVYGIGARLDSRPELLFELRGVDAQELISEPSLPPLGAEAPGALLEGVDLAALFGVEIEFGDGEGEDASKKKASKKKASKKKAAKRKAAPKKSAPKRKAPKRKAAPKKSAPKKSAPKKSGRAAEVAGPSAARRPMSKLETRLLGVIYASPGLNVHQLAARLERPLDDVRMALEFLSLRDWAEPRGASLGWHLMRG